MKPFIAVALLTSVSVHAETTTIEISAIDLNGDRQIAGKEEEDAVLAAAKRIAQQRERARIVVDGSLPDRLFRPDKTEVSGVLGFKSEPGINHESYGIGGNIKFRRVRIRQVPSSNLIAAAISTAMPDTFNFQLDLSVKSERELVETQRTRVDRIEIFPFRFTYQPNGSNITPFIKLGHAWSETKKTFFDGSSLPSEENEGETSWQLGLAYSPSDVPWGLEIGQTWRFKGFASGKNSDSLDITIKRAFEH